MQAESSPLVGAGAVLVDSSVWILHLRFPDARMAALLRDEIVVMHPAVHGELACGNLPTRARTLALFETLPSVRPASDTAVLELIERAGFSGRGVGWIDCHLLAACKLWGPFLWTRDKRLREVAVEVPGEEKVWG